MNLRTFTTTKVLDNRRLARQAKEIANFDLIIKYIKGTDNARADALSRKLGYEDDKTYKEVALFKTLENGDLVSNIREIAIVERDELQIQRIKDVTALDDYLTNLPIVLAYVRKEGILYYEKKLQVSKALARELIKD